MSIFEPRDHLRHQPAANGKMRDSLFWQTTFPDGKLGFQAYLYMTAAGKAGFNVIVWGGERPALERVESELPEGMDLNAMHFEGFALRNAPPDQPAQLSFEGSKIRFELTFVGAHEAFSYRDNPDGLPEWFATNRFEQSGRLTGFIEVRGERMAIDQSAHRDHSWGNRNWGVPQHWKWFCAYVPDGSVSLNGWYYVARGETGCAGYVQRNGLAVPIATMRHHARYDAQMAQTALRATITDIEGGTTELTLDSFGLVRLPTGDKLGTVIQEAACAATIDGAAGVGQFETHWLQSYLDHLIETDSTS